MFKRYYHGPTKNYRSRLWRPTLYDRSRIYKCEPLQEMVLKIFLGVCDFALLNTFTAWNLSTKSVDKLGQVQRRKWLLIKWEFYSVTAEEMMTYVDNNEIINLVLAWVYQDNDHIPTPIAASYKWNNLHVLCAP